MDENMNIDDNEKSEYLTELSHKVSNDQEIEKCGNVKNAYINKIKSLLGLNEEIDIMNKGSKGVSGNSQ